MPCGFDRLGTVDQAAGTYGVGWKCKTCKFQGLDVCPIGPLVPSPGNCLNCGGAFTANSDTCPACGLAESELLELIAAASPHDDFCKLANDCFHQGLYRLGVAALNYALREEPGQLDVWIFKGEALDALGFHNSKLAMFQDALAAGAPIDLAVNLGNELYTQKRYVDAAVAQQKYLDAEPDGAHAALAEYNLANAYFRLNDHEGAEKLYRSALAREPQRKAFSYMLAYLLDSLGRQDEALAVLDEALQTPNPDDRFTARLYEERAFIHAERQDGQNSLLDVTRAMGFGIDTVEVHYLRGRALALLGRLPEAREEMLYVIERQPDHPDAQRALKLIGQVLG
ncbi:MAG: tetratricopeptide repeat protein [Gemmataceae bacterium]